MSIGSTVPNGTTINLGSEGPVRVEVEVSTASTANGDTDEGVWDLGYLASNLLVVEANAAGYLVLYVNEAARDADLRELPSGLDPDPGVGILCDFAFDTGGSNTPIEVSPPILLYNNDGSPVTDIYYRFYRSEAGTGVADFTLTILGLEA